jgi:hypothetical protein
MDGKFNAGKYLKIVLGLLVIIAGLYSYTLTYFGGTPWLYNLLDLIKGGFGLGVMFVGLIIAAIGATD